MRITTTMLRRRGACSPQREKFDALFPNGVTVTRELCLRHAHDFDFEWAADHLLFGAAAEAYNAARARAFEAYQAARTPAFEAYLATKAPAFQAASSAAFEAYQAASASAWEAYEAESALAFYDATQIHDASLDN